MDNLELLQLVYTRISHDLAGMIGAVYNGAELLEEDLSFAQESANLIKGSAENLMARQRFFRQTFGLPKESEDTTVDYLATFSMPFSMDKECVNNLQRSLIMCLTDYFYKGAQFQISENLIEAKGQALKDIQEFKNILLNADGEKTAANAPAFYTHYMAKKLNCHFDIKQSENTLQIRLDFANTL